MNEVTTQMKMETMEALKLARRRIENSKLGEAEVGQDVLKIFDTCYDLLMQDAIKEGNKSNYARRFAFDVLTCFTAPDTMLDLFDVVHALAKAVLLTADADMSRNKPTTIIEPVVKQVDDEPINGKGIDLLRMFEGGKQ